MVSAGLMPMQVYGFAEFQGVKYANQKITLHSNKYDYDWVTYTNSNGQFQFVLNNLRTDLNQEISEEDSMYIDVCAYDVNPECRIVYSVSENPTDVTEDITSSGASDLTTPGAVDADTVTDTDTTSDTDITNTCGDCTCTPTNCGAVTCPSCPACDNTTCPEPDSNGILIGSLIAAIVVSGASGIYFTRNKTLGKGGGLKEYKKTDGSIGLFHKHPGIRGYHDPKTSHRDKHEKHLSGQLRPQYEKNEKGVWVYKN